MKRTGPAAWALMALVVAAWAVPASLPGSSSAFTGTTSNTGNALSGLTVQPPTNVDATMTLNVLPLLTCRSNITWTASTTPGVTGYWVERVRVSDGGVDAGPWSVAGTSYLDNPVPLQLIGSSYEWRVRSRLGSTTWTSAWVTATPINLLACLL